MIKLFKSSIALFMTLILILLKTDITILASTKHAIYIIPTLTL